MTFLPKNAVNWTASTLRVPATRYLESLTAMNRRKLTFEESVQRTCSLRLTNCGGPTAHGVGGYACENCLAHILTQFSDDQRLSRQRCSHCGNSPTFVTSNSTAVCESCTAQGLAAARRWYNKEGVG